MASLTLDLFRSCRRNRVKPDKIKEAFAASGGAGSLYPDYVGFTREDSSVRPPDVTTYPNEGETWVRGVDDVDSSGHRFVNADEGVSLSDKPGKFGYGPWFYFLLPKGTVIPPGLDVVQTGRDRSHYSIRCRNAMSQTAYHGALDNFARSGIARSVELAKSSLYFKAGD